MRHKISRKSRRLHDLRRLRTPQLMLDCLCLGPAAPFSCGCCRLSCWHSNLNLRFASCSQLSKGAGKQIQKWRDGSIQKRERGGAKAGAAGDVGCVDVCSFCEGVGCRSSDSNGIISSQATSNGEASASLWVFCSMESGCWSGSTISGRGRASMSSSPLKTSRSNSSGRNRPSQ